MSWTDRFRRQPWWKAAISDVQADCAVLRIEVGLVNSKLDKTLREIRIMGVREEANYQRLIEDLNKIAAGWPALVAENAALKEALANADADKAAALEADSELDADKIAAANAVIADLVADPEVPVEPPVEEPPAEEPQV